MEKIKLLLVDDSMVIRRALRECFRDDPEIQVVGVAESGLRALEQIEALKPDIITLDIEMPDMDGLETLRCLRERGSELPVIVFSKHTSHGAKITMDVLELGASDVVAKPVAHGGKGSPCEIVKRQLRSRVRALGRRAHRLLSPKQLSVSPLVVPTAIFDIGRQMEAVGIAISTGGPAALIEIVTNLEPDIQAPIFITQHMPPGFTHFLAERLAVRGKLAATEAQDGMIVQTGTIYVAPGDFHLEIVGALDGDRIRLSQSEPENSCRPSADVMFRSLAERYGAGLLSIVMTGMGNDGRRGCEIAKAHGGVVVAQDEQSSLVWGMPRAVITAGLHDAVVPLSGIASLISRNCRRIGGD
ncbi:MAG: chemotaxis response regulator protein-glutamate methylesterase [Pseudomonadota bacterium]|jgi:two-component system chemotaxis response regulator CheB